MTIRLAAPRDAPQLAALHAQCFDQPWDEAAFSAFLDDGVTFALLSAEGREAQAFILVRAAADESEILSLGTHPCARRRGLARALLDAACVEAQRRGAGRMFLEVAGDNAAALALYRAAGFATTGRRNAYYARPMGQAADAVVLSIALRA